MALNGYWSNMGPVKLNWIFQANKNKILATFSKMTNFFRPYYLNDLIAYVIKRAEIDSVRILGLSLNQSGGPKIVQKGRFS